MIKQGLEFYSELDKPEEAVQFYIVCDAGRAEGNTINLKPSDVVARFNALLEACEKASNHFAPEESETMAPEDQEVCDELAAAVESARAEAPKEGDDEHATN